MRNKLIKITSNVIVGLATYFVSYKLLHTSMDTAWLAFLISYYHCVSMDKEVIVSFKEN